MYSKEELNALFEKIVENINISDSLFDNAEKEYTNLGQWIDSETPDYKILIYPQGSFALGTVIKPISENDDYDLDLVCEFERQYNLSAKQIKRDVVGPLLSKYSKIKTLEEKRRCWHVEYENIPNFHMDVIPAVNKSSYIDITDHDEDIGRYDYIGSNPKGYIEWFNKRKLKRRTALYESYIAEKRHITKFQAEVETIKEYIFKTPLQKAIQLLKRHRDIMFEKDEASIKPVSIIITTIAAQLYNNEDNIVDTITAILNGAENYLQTSKVNGEFHVDNPSYTGEKTENFADKWNEHPDRADAFFSWLENAKMVFITSTIESSTETDLASILGMSLGDSIIKKVFSDTTDVVSALTKKENDTSMALVPYKVRSILLAPHRQSCPWGTPKGSRVIISATATTSNGQKFKYTNDGPALIKGTSLDFRALFGGISQPFNVQWQIVNLGTEAASKHGLRGDFELSNVGKFVRREGTEYTGSHSIQCFVTKRGRCVAKSDIFIVNIQ